MTIIVFSRDVSDNVTGIVYTDEGGQEQSLLGKLVYTTDETGSSNIILQVLLQLFTEMRGGVCVVDGGFIHLNHCYLF